MAHLYCFLTSTIATLPSTKAYTKITFIIYTQDYMYSYLQIPQVIFMILYGSVTKLAFSVQ